MLRQRIITAIIGGAAVISLTYMGGVWFQGLLTVVALLAFYELSQMQSWSGRYIHVVLGAALTIMFLFMTTRLPFEFFIILLYLLLAIPVFSKNQITFQDVTFIAFGAAYIGIGLHYGIIFRELPDGLSWIVYVLAVVWSTDSFAYFIGRMLQGPKIWPAISPNKTVSGSAGGILGSIVVGGLVATSTGLLDWNNAVWVTLMISVASQVGDLAESAIKRSLHVKDSGGLLPGHGGFLDRIDSLLFALPLAYWAIMLVR